MMERKCLHLFVRPSRDGILMHFGMCFFGELIHSFQGMFFSYIHELEVDGLTN